MFFNNIKHAARISLTLGRHNGCWRAVILLGLIVSVSAPVAAAHTFHTSLMRLEYNEKEKSGEITLQLFAHDLETALTRANQGVRVNLEKDKDLPARVLAYLESNFVLKNSSGVVAKLAWVGLESKGDTVTIYVETPLPEGLAGAQIRNTIFFDIADKQVNLINIVLPEGKTALSYEHGDTSFKIISLPATELLNYDR